MRSFAALLLACVAVASALHGLDDSFLQEHGHMVISTQVTEKDDNFQFVEHADLVSTIGFCVRNFEKTGITEAGNCISNSFRSRKATLQLLKTFLKQTAQKANGDLDVDIVVSDDGSIKVGSNGLTWIASGTVTVNGKGVAYNRTGLLNTSDKRVTFEEVIQILGVTSNGDDVNGGAAIYLDVDIYTFKKETYTQIGTKSSLHHGAGVSITGDDGSVTEATRSGQMTVNGNTIVQNDNQTVIIQSAGMAAGTEIGHYHKTNSDGSETHVSASMSDAVDTRGSVEIDFGTDEIEIEAVQMIGFGHHIYVGKPAVRQYGTASVRKTGSVSGDKKKFTISSQDTFMVDGAVLDYEDNALGSFFGEGEVDNEVVTVGSDASEDVVGNINGTANFVVTPVKGDKVKISVTSSITSHVSGTNDGSGNIKGHADIEAEIKVHTE